MKKIRTVALLFLVALLSLTTFSGCNDKKETAFSYSDGIDENGFWKGIKALDYVTLFDHQAMPIPADVHQISAEEIQTEVDGLLSYFSEEKQVTDRPVANLDNVNIDFVGSVNGVEFAGETTEGAGTTVQVGVTNYIDDFLEQLIGHTPGETFNVEVTFPEDYGNENLNGKDAIFVTTINYIVEESKPELTDEFVVSNLSAYYDWTTVEEVYQGITSELQIDKVTEYINNFLYNNVTVSEPPKQLITYLENSMFQYFQEIAAQYGVDFEEFLTGYLGVSTKEELAELYHDSNMQQAKYYLVIQAIAEDANITVTDADIEAYFLETTGAPLESSTYVEQYGMPYIKQIVLNQMVLDYLYDHAVLS